MRGSYLDDDQYLDDDRASGEQARDDGRPGPQLLANDAWDGARDDDSNRYHGRRRARIAGRRRLGAIAALVATVGAVTWVVALRPQPEDLPPTTTLPAVEGTRSTMDNSSTSPTVSPDTSSTPKGTTIARATETRTATQPPFPTVTFEAETGSAAVTLSGSAQVQTYPRASGGKIVSRLGAWDDGQQAPGTMRINDLNIPSAGSYLIDIYFTNSESSGPRTGVIGVSGAKTVTITFTGGHNCCGVRHLEIPLDAGVHTITISNPTDIAPSIDRIVVSRRS